MRPVRALSALSVTLLLAACSAGDEPEDAVTPTPTGSDARATAVPSPSPRPDTAPTASPTPGEPVAVPDDDVPALDARCTVQTDAPDSVTVEYAVPSSWQVEGRCDLLDPDREELPDATDVEVAVVVSVTGAAYADVAGPDPGRRDTSTALGAVAGLQRSRTTGTSTGVGLSPEGRPLLSHAVDLDPGTDDDGGTLTISTGVGGDDFPLAAAAVDRIAATVVVRPGADVSVPVVLRTEGGGAPLAVTADQGCLRLHDGAPTDPVVAEVCDLGQPPVATVVEGAVVVGVAPPGTTLVRPAGPGDGPGAVTSSAEGGELFAMPVADVPDEVVMVAPGGDQELARVVVDG